MWRQYAKECEMKRNESAGPRVSSVPPKKAVLESPRKKTFSREPSPDQISRDIESKVSITSKEEPKQLAPAPNSFAATSPFENELNQNNNLDIFSKPPLQPTMDMNMFDIANRVERKAPKMPETTDIEYPRAASWVSGTIHELLNDSIGRQVFQCFLYECLADENLTFVDDIKRLRKLTDKGEKMDLMNDLLKRCTLSVNVSSPALQKIKKGLLEGDPQVGCFDAAEKEVTKLLENDQFPRFRRSVLYINFLEELLPKAYAKKWGSSFEALLGNQVGRFYFRNFLQSIHAEENLRFWEAVVEFRAAKSKSVAMLNLGRNIQQTFLREGTTNEVFLPFGLRQTMEKRIQQKEVDVNLFDDAIKHVEQVLKNDPYVRFLQSKEYNDLLNRLK
uniref:RGS domain-containing protein n=1 Tax=Rhabditophanes sp. KR3021 TaxID=114890 RepID=A0AC35U7L3_9BILA